MPDIRTAKLELLRNGPEHNQLLSPLTPYIALCGPRAPQTVTMPFEHRELTTRLARLRYNVPAPQREAELVSIGSAVGRVLGAVPGLQAELSDSGRDGAHLVHLRLSLSALELGMMPFEAAIAPDNLPGSGAALLLRTPTVITREIRRSDVVDVKWNRVHRILYAFATPPGMAPVPAQQHLNALRRAIDPYVAIVGGDDAKDKRVADVTKQLTILPEATLKNIADACRDGDYTHVHILAHGAPFGDDDQKRFGVALRDDGEPAGYKVVDGETLAIALRGAQTSTAVTKALPTFLSLATCDSGAVESVVVPGGSIAHELHRVGIPWVVASQFPLWMNASTIMVEALYSRLLAGDDPRLVLHLLRQRLRVEVPQTHDWASIVAYAIAPWDLEQQVDAFFDRQIRRRLEVFFARLDDLAAKLLQAKDQPMDPADDAEFTRISAAIRKEHAAWLARPAIKRNAKARAEAEGMSAASEKRIAIACANKASEAGKRGDKDAAEAALAACDAAYTASYRAYRRAVEADPTNHWAITQFVSIAATPRRTQDQGAIDGVRDRYADWWTAARQISNWQLRAAAAGEARAWALGTLAELDLLGTVYQTEHDAKTARERISRGCAEIVQLCGAGSFQVESTLRQFQRYRMVWDHLRWRDHAQAAIDALTAED